MNRSSYPPPPPPPPAFSPAALTAAALALALLSACGGGGGGGAAAPARTPWAFSDPPVECPAGYVAVFANEALGTGHFCVMAFEARNASGAPVSQAAGTPWTSILHAPAQAACEGVAGTGDFAGGTFTLISNPEWMALAREIENVPVNWSGGSVGNGHVPRGHSDNAPASVLGVADPDDAWSGTGQDGSEEPGLGWEQKRTHRTKSGGTVWDLAGNADELVDWDPSDAGFTPRAGEPAPWAACGASPGRRWTGRRRGPISRRRTSCPGASTPRTPVSIPWASGHPTPAKRAMASFLSREGDTQTMSSWACSHSPSRKTRAPSHRSAFRCVYRPPSS